LVFVGCNKNEVSRVFFKNLKDGELVKSPLKIEMGVENLVVEPATAGINPGKGHFHILINKPAVPAPNPIPKDEAHIHYGMGDSVATLELAPGDYDLVLQFATGDHVSYNPPIIDQVKITVVEN
jgi:hypothetical protein